MTTTTLIRARRSVSGAATGTPPPPTRELMRPGMGKVFKQILDAQAKAAKEPPTSVGGVASPADR